MIAGPNSSDQDDSPRSTPNQGDPGITSDARLETLEELYEAYHRRALGLAYYMVGSRADAEEIVQEAFLALWRSGQSFDPQKGAASSWVLAAVRNRAIDLLRSRRRRPQEPLGEGADPADPSDAVSEAETRVDNAVTRQALDVLPPEQRQVIELAYYAGLSQSEIATLVQIPIGTVKGRVRLALDRLRVALAGTQDFSPAS